MKEHDSWKGLRTKINLIIAAIAEAKLGKRSFLILGGCGFIGRNLVEHLYSKNLATNIVVADKAIPDIAYLGAQHKTIFKTQLVRYVACDIARQGVL